MAGDILAASQGVLVVKNLPADAGDVRGVGSIPGSGRPPEGGHGSPLQYSCLENPMARRASWAMVHRVTQSRTRLKRLSMNTVIFLPYHNFLLDLMYFLSEGFFILLIFLRSKY